MCKVRIGEFVYGWFWEKGRLCAKHFIDGDECGVFFLFLDVWMERRVDCFVESGIIYIFFIYVCLYYVFVFIFYLRGFVLLMGPRATEFITLLIYLINQESRIACPCGRSC